MGYLRSGISRSVAVLSACGVIAVSAVSFAAIDKTVIKPCDVLPPDNAKVVTEDNAVRAEIMGDVTSAEITAKETSVNSKTEAAKVVKTEATTTSASATTTAAETVPTQTTTAVPVSELPASVTASQSASEIVSTAPAVLTGSKMSVSKITRATAGETKHTSASTTSVTTSETEETEPVTTTSLPVTEETTEETTSVTVPSSEETTTAASKVTTAENTSSATTTAKTTVSTTTTPQQTTTSAATTTKKPSTTTTVTTTKKPVTTTTTVKPVDNGKTPESRLNSATLVPNATLSGNEDKIIRKYLAKIVTDDMTGYQKALACYDYLIKNTYYAYGGWSKPVQAVLEEGYGTCTEYSYVYAAMLNYLGFSAKTVDGMTAMAAGGYGYHMWVEVTINGQIYVMDPQVDDNMSWGGNISHDRFCRTYDEVKGKYLKS